MVQGMSKDAHETTHFQASRRGVSVRGLFRILQHALIISFLALTAFVLYSPNRGINYSVQTPLGKIIIGSDGSGWLLWLQWAESLADVREEHASLGGLITANSSFPERQRSVADSFHSCIRFANASGFQLVGFGCGVLYISFSPSLHVYMNHVWTVSLSFLVLWFLDGRRLVGRLRNRNQGKSSP